MIFSKNTCKIEEREIDGSFDLFGFDEITFPDIGIFAGSGIKEKNSFTPLHFLIYEKLEYEKMPEGMEETMKMQIYIVDDGFFENLKSQIIKAISEKSIKELNKNAEKLRSEIAKAEVVQMIGWSSKFFIAQRVVDGVATVEEKKALAVEAQYRGKNETVLEIAEKQVSKGIAMHLAISFIDGFVAKGEAMLSSCKTEEEIKTTATLLWSEAEEAKKTLFSKI